VHLLSEGFGAQHETGVGAKLKRQLKGAGYNYRAKQSYFEELVLDGAQGALRVAIHAHQAVAKRHFVQFKPPTRGFSIRCSTD